MEFSDFNSLKVLIVDDQMDARAILRNMLSEFGVNQIFEATNGKEAKSFIDNASDLFDLVICDWNMPELSGMELLERFRAKEIKKPFVMITGRSDTKSVIDAKKSGVDAYIRKPYSRDQLEVKLRVVMNKEKAA